jgi:PKD repeat protein
MKITKRLWAALALVALLAMASPGVAAQEQPAEDPDDNQPADARAASNPTPDAGPPKNVLDGQQINFDAESFKPQEATIEEILWDFGDGTRAVGAKTNHAYTASGSYLVTLRIKTDQETYTDTTGVRVFEHAMMLVSDSSAPADQVELHQGQAAKNDILLFSLRAQGSGPEVLIEEELTERLINARNELDDAHTIIVWSSGGVGANALTKFAQRLRQAKSPSAEDLSLGNKGIILVSETPFAVLKPTAQSAFDQLNPSYVLLARPQVLDLLLTTTSAEEAKEAVLSSPLEYRLLGTFSARTAFDLGITNFMSFGINFLVNRGVPINSIVLILMLPVIATILAFARQVIGIKAFGLLTPAMTCVSFLVMGLRYGIIVFIAILIAGTATRFILRKLRLLYLPRMALVLTSISLALLVLLGLGAVSTNDRTSILSFSIFPALILTILAEDFIAAQFKSGLRVALTITAWTLALATVSYVIVSSEIFRTLILSYPEIILLAIPINIVLGQWSGLRLTEYFRFRELLRHGKAAP